MLPPQPDRDEAVIAESKTRLKKPRLYRVILHNDDYTTMDFVVFVLEKVFHRGQGEAIQLMLQVHMNGFGVAGLFTHEIAEMKVNEVTELARASEYPLLCTMEEEK